MDMFDYTGEGANSTMYAKHDEGRIKEQDIYHDLSNNVR